MWLSAVSWKEMQIRLNWRTRRGVAILTVSRRWCQFKNCSHSEVKLKQKQFQNSFQTVLKQFSNCFVCFSFISLCAQFKPWARRPHAASSWVVGDLPQFSELAKCLLVDHACVSSLKVVAPTLLSGPCCDLQSTAAERHGLRNMSHAVSKLTEVTLVGGVDQLIS